jgi:LuxR family maltose regulon positive regulatory protein
MKISGNSTKQSTALAKITRPAIGDVLIRERLFKQLDAARLKPVTCISSPAGSGKTTLVTSYLKSRGLDCLWYQVDAGDGDLATFFYYLGLAGKKAAPRHRKPLPLFTPEYMDGIPEFSRNFFGDLFGRLKNPSTLIFDNYQDVQENASLHGALVEGLSRLPEGVNIMLVSRSSEPPAYARLKANRFVAGLNWSDLRLTEDEFEKILEKRCKKKAPREVLRDIYQRLDGWAAGLHLIVESACPDHFEILRYIIEGTPEEIFDYFACEILERQDEDTRDFLTKTAFLPHTTPEMAQQFTGHPQAMRILSILNKKNHFTEKRTQPQVSYHFHPLFREFLLQRASEIYSQAELIELKRQAAAILIKANQPAAAVQLLQEAEDWDGLAELIENEAPTLISQGRNQVLEAWIRSLPENHLESRPWLLYWLGNARIMYDPHESCDLLEKSFYIFKESADYTNMFRAWAGMSDAIFYCLSGYQRYDSWLALFEELYEKYSSYITGDIELQVTGGVLNAIIHRQPYHPDYESWVQQAFAHMEKSNDIPTKVHVLHILWISTMLRHDHAKGSRYIEAFQGFTQYAEVPPWGVMLMLEDASFHYSIVGRFEDSMQTVTKGLEMAAETGVHYLDHWFWAVGASAALSQGKIKEADQYLGLMQTHMHTIRDWQKTLYYALTFHRAILQGDMNRAERIEKSTTQYAIKTGVINPIINHLQILLMWQKEKNYKKVKRAVSIILKIHRRYGMEGQLGFEVYLTEAYIALEHGDEATALSSLKKGMGIGRKTGALNYWGWLPSVMARVCEKALEEGIEVEYVQELVRKRNIVPEKSPITIENWPWPIRIYTLGRFEVVLDDKPLRFGRKAQQKPIDLLQVLIALGGRKIAETKIVDILWPDDDGDMQIKSLHTALYRLRKLLGHKDAIEYEDGRLSLNNRICWVDVWAFERLLGEVENLLEGKPKPNHVKHIKEKIFSLYQNAFLSQLTDRYWSVKLREKLKSKFIRVIEQFGKFYVEAGNNKEAIELYSKALDVDPLLESCYRQIMLSYKSLGKTSEAVNTYRNCTRIMKSSLGVEPGKETVQIYNKLCNAANSK